jgi:hypothetical protein
MILKSVHDAKARVGDVNLSEPAMRRKMTERVAALHGSRSTAVAPVDSAMMPSRG